MSDVEDLEAQCGVNALQNGDTCYFCKKTGHQKRECRKFEEWKKKNPHRKPGGTRETPIVLIPAHQFCVIIVGKRVIYHGNVEENRGIREGEEMEYYGGGQMADMAKSVAAIQEVLKKLVPEAVFP